MFKISLKEIANKNHFDDERFMKYVKYNHQDKVINNIFGVQTIYDKDESSIVKSYEKYINDLDKGNNSLTNKCPKCDSKNIDIKISQITKQKERISLGSLLLLISLLLFLFGATPLDVIILIIGIIIMFSKETVTITKTIGVCKKCGYNWNVEDYTIIDIEKDVV